MMHAHHRPALVPEHNGAIGEQCAVSGACLLCMFRRGCMLSMAVMPSEQRVRVEAALGSSCRMKAVCMHEWQASSQQHQALLCS